MMKSRKLTNKSKKDYRQERSNQEKKNKPGQRDVNNSLNSYRPYDTMVLYGRTRPYCEPPALKEMSYAYRDNDQFVLQACRGSCDNFHYATARLKRDVGFITRMLKAGVNQAVMKHVSDKVLDEKCVALKMCRDRPELFRYFSDRIRSDRNIILKILDKMACKVDILCYINPSLLSDREICKLAISKNPSSFEHAHETIRGDREIAIIAIEKEGYMLRYAPDHLQNDEELVYLALRTSRRVLRYLPLEFSNNVGLALTLVMEDPLNYVHFTRHVQSNYEICLFVASKGGYKYLQYHHKEYSICKLAIEHEPWRYTQMSYEIQNDLDIAKQLVKHRDNWYLAPSIGMKAREASYYIRWVCMPPEDRKKEAMWYISKVLVENLRILRKMRPDGEFIKALIANDPDFQ